MGLIPKEIENAPIIADLYRLAVERCVPGGLYLEFGVASGRSLKQLRSLVDKKIPLYGFDSFQGLPEPWNGFPVGAFATDCRPCLTNTKLVVGHFEQTVESFAKEHPQHISLMHIDCDLYSATKTILDGLEGQIIAGTVIVFDELFGYAGYEQHEYRAFMEFVSKAKKPFKVIGRWNAYRAVIQF